MAGPVSWSEKEENRATGKTFGFLLFGAPVSKELEKTGPKAPFRRLRRNLQFKQVLQLPYNEKRVRAIDGPQRVKLARGQAFRLHDAP